MDISDKKSAVFAMGTITAHKKTGAGISGQSKCTTLSPKASNPIPEPQRLEGLMNLLDKN